MLLFQYVWLCTVGFLQSMAQGNETVFWPAICLSCSLIRCLCFMECASDLRVLSLNACMVLQLWFSRYLLLTHSIHGMGFTSVNTRNIFTVCNLFSWSPGDFIPGKVSLYYDNRFNHKFKQGLSDHENAVAEFVNELVLLCDGHLHLPSCMCM